MSAQYPFEAKQYLECQKATSNIRIRCKGGDNTVEGLYRQYILKSEKSVEGYSSSEFYREHGRVVDMGKFLESKLCACFFALH